MKNIYTFFLAFFIFTISAQAMTTDEASLVFIKAGAAYQTADVDDAIKQYESILNEGLASSAVYYNLGNAYFKKEELGEAILNYKRAYRLDPRDPDIQANLSYATSMVTQYGDPIETPFIERMMPHIDLFTEDEITLMVIMLFMLLGGAVLAALFLKWSLTQKIITIFVCIGLLVFHVFTLNYKAAQFNNHAILTDEVKARFEPMNDATVHFQLGEGAEVLILSEQYGWVKIQRHDGRIGWINKSFLEKI